MITEVRVPDPGPRAGGTYLKLERKVGDFATVGVAVQVTLDNGNVGRAGIALTGVGPNNIRAAAAEEALRGAEPGRRGDRRGGPAGRGGGRAASTTSAARAEYKRNVVRVFTERGLRTAVEAAQRREERSEMTDGGSTEAASRGRSRSR